MTTELFLDTSTDKGLLALWRGGTLVEERSLRAGPFSSATLFPTIQEFLRGHALVPRSIDRFSAGIGPGSFTGLRVAASIQQSLAFACGKSWEGVGSLHLWVPPIPGPFVAMVDARSGGIYCQAASWAPGSYALLSAPARLSVEEALALAFEHGGTVVTPQAAPLRARLGPELAIEEVNPTSARSLPFLPRLLAPALDYGAAFPSHSKTLLQAGKS